MRIFYSIEDFEKTGYKSHVALGFFDGVHLGHRAVLNDCAADKGGCMAVALTFADSPARILGRSKAGLLTDNRRKAELMETAGIDAVIFADFERMKDMDAQAFITDVLFGQLRAKKVSCGYNYRFGRNGAGNTEMLKERGGKIGIEVSVIQPVASGGRTVSSSVIRELLQNGGIEEADRMLGYPYAVRGRIDSGNHIGSAMGVPTVNLTVGVGFVVPRYGVYASRITIGGRTYRGATNIGVHPTVGENETPLCETFLLDFDGGELYGEEAACELLRFIRPEQRFASPDELKVQIGKDIERIQLLGEG